VARGDTLVLGLFGSHGNKGAVDVQYALGDRTMVVTRARHRGALE
jgi:hypothetical protein